MRIDTAVLAARKRLAEAAQAFTDADREFARTREPSGRISAMLALLDAADAYGAAVRERGLGHGCPLCGRSEDHVHGGIA